VGKPRTVLIVRLGSLGDLVHVLPAAAALREAWPDARIDWLVEPPHAALLDLVPVITRVRVLKERSAAGWLATRRELRVDAYDLAIDFQGLVKSAALAWLSGARQVVGFDTAALRESSARWLYTRQHTVGEGRHVIEKNLALARAVAGIGSGEPATFRFPLQLQPSLAADQVRAYAGGPFVLLNPGAAWPNKRWAPDRFADVARRVRQQFGWPSVVLWGPGERDLAASIVSTAGEAALLAPETTFNDLLALASEARLMVSGDTGPVHLAAARGCPIVAVFGPTTPDRNGPWDDRDVSISRYADCACHYQRTCQRAGRWCLESIGVDEVMAAITRRVAA
jgi:lipopolysaccharide heptosyltransferase I